MQGRIRERQKDQTENTLARPDIAEMLARYTRADDLNRKGLRRQLRDYYQAESLSADTVRRLVALVVPDEAAAASGTIRKKRSERGTRYERR